MRKLILTVVLFFCLLILSCSENNVAVDEEVIAISGEVVDASGNPIKGAGIHLLLTDFYWGRTSLSGIASIEDSVTVPAGYNLYQNYPNPFDPTTTIKFTIPKQDSVLVEVSTWPSLVPIDTLQNGHLRAGSYAYRWPTKNNYPSGMYLFKIMADSFYDYRIACLQRPYLSKSNYYYFQPFDSTDSNGKFQIEYENLPIGGEIPVIDDNGYPLGNSTVQDTLEFIFVKDGYQVVTQKAFIDSSKELSMEVILPFDN